MFCGCSSKLPFFSFPRSRSRSPKAMRSRFSSRGSVGSLEPAEGPKSPEAIESARAPLPCACISALSSEHSDSSASSSELGSNDKRLRDRGSRMKWLMEQNKLHQQTKTSKEKKCKQFTVLSTRRTFLRHFPKANPTCFCACIFHSGESASADGQKSAGRSSPLAACRPAPG